MDNQQPPVPTIRQRPGPMGSWPKHTKLWLMGLVAVGFVLLTLFGSAKPTTPAGRQTPEATVPPTPPETVRGLQQRMDEQARRLQPPQPIAQAESEPVRTAETSTRRSESPEQQDEIRTERKRKDYQSLFASNVVDSARQQPPQPTMAQPGTAGLSSPPSTAEVAALLRAMQPSAPATISVQSEPSAVAPRPVSAPQPAPVPNWPLYPVAQGSVVDTVLVNRIEGSTAGPVNVMVTSAVYAPDHHTVLIPVGARFVGASTPVASYGQSRLAVTFQRLQLPSGASYRLESFPALSPLGESGLQDKTDNHMGAVIGASAAVGVISGLAQLVTGGFGRAASGGGTVIIAGGAAEGTSQATSMVMNRQLNRMPTVTITEGHEVKVYTTADLNLPAYHVRLPRSNAPQIAQQ